MNTHKRTSLFPSFVSIIFRVVIAAVAIVSVLLIGIVAVSFFQRYIPKSYRNEVGGQGVYVYTEKALYRVLKIAGYSDEWLARSGLGYGYHVTRNSTGTELRCVHPTTRKALVLSCDGSITERDVPGYPTWFDDARKVVAWQQQGRIHYTNGEYSEPVNQAFGLGEKPDPSGQFFVTTQDAEHTNVYSLKQPHHNRATIPSLCGWDGLYVKHENIFLFGNACTAQQKSGNLELQIFQFDEETLKQQEVVEIPEPERDGAVVVVKDFSPWNNEVLLLDLYDYMERSVYYVVDFRTGELRELGKEPWSDIGGFFLHCDILQEVTKRLEEKRGNE